MDGQPFLHIHTLTRVRPFHAFESEALASLTRPYPCQQCTLPQNFICFPLPAHGRQKREDPCGLMGGWALGAMRFCLKEDKVESNWGRPRMLSSGLYTWYNCTCTHMLIHMHTCNPSHKMKTVIQTLPVVSAARRLSWEVCLSLGFWDQLSQHHKILPPLLKTGQISELNKKEN